jgi:NAD-dependent dihydropyrimidine dehydrogenase PreA subunit
MKRKIITIDNDRCTGCGLCIPNCPEGAIQLIDGKARLISDLFCDGLGACLGHCPEGAITLEEREAAAYDEPRVMENIIQAGPNTIKAHLEHLRDHGQKEFLAQALQVLKQKGIPNPLEVAAVRPSGGHHGHGGGGGCPGSRAMSFEKPAAEAQPAQGTRPSQLTHWPVQLHLISPQAPHFQGSDLLLAADCTAFSLGDFHKDFLKGRTLVIACPKLDEGQETYVEKLKVLIDEAKINTLTVLIMQVPCCSGLLRLAKEAASQAARKVPIKCVVVGLQGTILKEEWV